MWELKREHTCEEVEEQMEFGMLVGKNRVELKFGTQKVKVSLGEHRAVCTNVT